MAGSITVATAAASAGPEPEMPPITMATRIATTPKLPRHVPTRALARWTRRAATPARSKITPARMNTGIASSGYLAMPV